MNDWLPGKDEIRRYERDGFLAVPGLLTPPEVERFRAAAMAIVDRRRSERRDLDGWEKVFLQEHVVWQRDPVLRELTMHPRLAAVATALSGADRLRVFLDQIICKFPGDTATLAHQDAPFLSFTDHRSLNAWIALGTVTKAHGAMRYFAGSHGLGVLRMVDLGHPDDLLVNELPELAEHPIVEVPAEPGDVVFHNCLAVHEAHPNVSDEDRLAYSVQYMPDGARYNGWEHPFLEPLKLTAGDELGQDDYFPPVTVNARGEGAQR